MSYSVPNSPQQKGSPAKNVSSAEVEKLCHIHPTIPHEFKYLEDGYWSGRFL